jgi:hypothetical protein
MGPITTFFARIFGKDSLNVNAVATAALSGLGSVNEGDLPVPLGISYAWYFRPLDPDGFCGDYVAFSPTNDPDACAGWTTFDYSPSNDPTLRDLISGDLNSPALEIGDDVEFIGGEMSQQVFGEFMEAYKSRGYDVASPTANDPFPPAATLDNGEIVTGPLFDGDDGHGNTIPLMVDGEQLYYPNPQNGQPDLDQPRNKHVWHTYVLVYNWDDCANPNTTIDILGFTPMTITDVWDAGGPDGKTIRGMVRCDEITPEDLRGGGADLGLKGSIPGLVE